jgi:IS5 family transposase
VHDITRASQLLHGDEQVVYCDVAYQGIEKREEVADKSITFGLLRGQESASYTPPPPDGRLPELAETAKAHISAKVEQPVRVIKYQFGFQKTRLRGMAKNHCKVNSRPRHNSVPRSRLSTGDRIRARLVCLSGVYWIENMQKGPGIGINPVALG